MRLKSAILLCMLVSAVLIQGCARQSKGMEVKGSDTMVNLGQAWAESYIKDHPGTNINVTGGGSGTGIAALIAGTSDITQASREMKPEEIAQATKKGVAPKQFIVARDGVSVIVNKKNPVSKLTIAQLSDIYTAKVTNWKQLGGPDQPISVLSRDKSSGTHVFFLEHVVESTDKKAQYAKSVLMPQSSQAIADQVASTPGAIGYVGMGYVDKNKHKVILVAKQAGGAYIEPTEDTVLNNTYPIARPLYFYTPGEPQGLAKEFIDFVLSDAGQQIVVKQEFVPIRKMK